MNRNDLLLLYEAGRDAAASLEMVEVARRSAKHLVVALNATSACVLTLEEKSSAAPVVAQHLSPKTGPNEMMEVGSTYDA
jgi:hypothetical protein